jgi:hypothetical protein
MYNVTVRCVRAAIVAVESFKYYVLWVCVYILSVVIRHGTGICSGQHCIVIGCLAGPNVSFRINGTIFGKGLLIKKCVSIFCATLVWNICHSKKNSARCYHKCVPDFIRSNPYSCQIVINFNFRDRFWKNPSSGSRGVGCGRIDRWTWRSWRSLFAIFRTRLTTGLCVIRLALDT